MYAYTKLQLKHLDETYEEQHEDLLKPRNPVFETFVEIPSVFICEPSLSVVFHKVNKVLGNECVIGRHTVGISHIGRSIPARSLVLSGKYILSGTY